MATATLGNGITGTLDTTLRILVVETSGRPETVIISGENSKGIFVTKFCGIHFVAFEQGALASSGSGLFGLYFAVIADSPLISDSLGDALGAKFELGAVNALFVLLASCVQLINWLSTTTSGHGAIRQHQTMASIIPMFSVIEAWIVVKCDRVQIVVATIADIRSREVTIINVENVLFWLRISKDQWSGGNGKDLHSLYIWFC